MNDALSRPVSTSDGGVNCEFARDTIEEWGARVIINLIEDHEMVVEIPTQSRFNECTTATDIWLTSPIWLVTIAACKHISRFNDESRRCYQSLNRDSPDDHHTRPSAWPFRLSIAILKPMRVTERFVPCRHWRQ